MPDFEISARAEEDLIGIARYTVKQTLQTGHVRDHVDLRFNPGGKV